MAREDYNMGVPSVLPSGSPGNDYQHIEATPGAFGAFEANALKQSGDELGKASGDISQIALLQQQRYNEVAHQQATNDFLQQVQGITWGTQDNPGVLQKQGADALGAWQQAQGDIDQLRQKIRGSLQNDAQRLAFDSTSRFYQLREQDRIGAHVDSQLRQYAIDTSNAGVKSAAMRAGADPTSDLDTLTREAYLNGTRLVQSRDGAAAAPVNVEVGQKVAAGAVVFSRLNSLADKDPAAAAALLKSGTIPSPDGKSRVPIESVLDETGRTQLAQKIESKAAQSIGTGAAMQQFQAASRANTGPIADRTLPPEAQKFLPALSGGEGNYGSPAPRGDRSGTPISNNRYQFLYNTWTTEAPKAGVALSDHSPEAQDKVAWSYAQNTYRDQSGGRDLAADIREGGHEATIASALNKVWPSLPGGSEQNTTLPQFISRLGQVASATNNLQVADRALSLTPQEKFLYQYHLDHLGGQDGGVVRQSNGATSTLLQTSQEHDGRFYNVPTIWAGKEHTEDEAAAHAAQIGWDKWPSYPTREAAEARYGLMHGYMEKDIAGGSAYPTTNDAQGPIPGGTRRQALQNIMANPDLQKNPAAMAHAMTMLDHLFTQDDRAVHVDAEAAFNEWIPQARLNPAGVDPNRIAGDNRLTGEQKSNLLALLADKSQGDGPAFARAFQNVYLPVGSPERINSYGDLFSLAGHGLTASGMSKLGKEIKDRDEPDSLVKKAALSGWQKQIEGFAGGVVTPGPISTAKWARFLGWALPEIEREKSAGKTMAQIISPTGDIAKNVSHYTLTPEEIPLNLGAPAAAAAPAAPAAPAMAAPVAGQWYVGRRVVPVGTAGARYYTGGAIADPASWPTSAPGAAPSAPTTER